MSRATPGDRVQQEHADLKELIGRIRATPAEPPLAELADNLAAHFGAEEAPTGWMAEATLQSPHLADLIDDIRSEHGAMLAAARGLAAGHGNPEAVEKLLQTLEEHERREAGVITEVWYEDLGGGD